MLEIDLACPECNHPSLKIVDPFNVYCPMCEAEFENTDFEDGKRIEEEYIKFFNNQSGFEYTLLKDD